MYVNVQKCTAAVLEKKVSVTFYNMIIIRFLSNNYDNVLWNYHAYTNNDSITLKFDNIA